MLIRKQYSDRRSGAVAVETALILSMTILILFGTFEYGRLLMDWNVLNNAAREGCRYALVNNTSTTVNADVTSVVTGYMGGNRQLQQLHCYRNRDAQRRLDPGQQSGGGRPYHG